MPTAHGTLDDAARRLLTYAVAKSKRTSGVPLAMGFLRRVRGDKDAPPLAQLLRGGRGGEVRLKLYLSMSLIAVGEPYDVTTPARTWAEMLGLPEPEKNGARRIADAIVWLDRNKLVAARRRQGAPARVTLSSQLGTGGTYRRPRPKDRYVSLPIGLWQNGWIVHLSGSAIAMLIVLLDMTNGGKESAWIAPAEAKQRYDLSPDTWREGAEELQEAGLVSVTTDSRGREFGWRRVRKTYSVHAEHLARAAPPRLTEAPDD